MNEEYKNLGWDNGTFKIELELPVEFKRDFVDKCMFGNKNKMAECFDRILSAIKNRDFSTIAMYEREICEVMKIAMGNAKIKRGLMATMEIRLDTLKTHIDEKIDEAVDDIDTLYDYVISAGGKIFSRRYYRCGKNGRSE